MDSDVHVQLGTSIGTTAGFFLNLPTDRFDLGTSLKLAASWNLSASI